MKKDKIEELKEKEKKLEKEIIEYLEVDDNRNASRKEKELDKVRDLIKLESMGTMLELKRDLDIYKKFINNKGMKNEFDLFFIAELARRYEKED